MHAVMLTILFLGGSQPAEENAVDRPTDAATETGVETASGECSACGPDGVQIVPTCGTHRAWNSCLDDWFGPAPQSCCGPRVVRGSAHQLRLYTTLHAAYYRKPFDYRRYFDYSWHVQPHASAAGCGCCLGEVGVEGHLPTMQHDALSAVPQRLPVAPSSGDDSQVLKSRYGAIRVVR